ncbi:MAG: hypothetical protein RR277_09320 [Rikenellaceae bacterium]
MKNIRFKYQFKKLATTAIFILIINVAFCAQQEVFFKVPNYDSINVNIHTATSDNYYPKIFERYMNGDTTLTLSPPLLWLHLQHKLQSSRG